MTSWSWSGSWVGSKPADFGPPASLTHPTQSTPAQPGAASSPTTTTTSSTTSSTSSTTSTSSSSSSSSHSSAPTSPAVEAPTPYSAPPSTPVNALSDSDNSSTSSGNKIGPILAGVLSVSLIAALLVGLLIYRRRKRSRSAENGFEYGSGAAEGVGKDAPGSSPGVGLAGGVLAGAAVGAALHSGKASNHHHEDQQFDRQHDSSGNMGHGSAMAAGGAAAVSAAHAYHASPSPPPPAHMTPTNDSRALPKTGLGTFAAATMVAGAASGGSHPSNHDSRAAADGPKPHQISAPVWGPNRYDNRASTVEYAYRGSTTSVCRDSELPAELEETSRTTSPWEPSKLGTMTEATPPPPPPPPARAATENLESRPQKTFSFNVSDMIGTSMAAAVVAASRVESGEEADLMNVNTEQPRPESGVDGFDPNDLSDIVSLRPSDRANDGSSKRSSNAVPLSLQALPPVLEEEALADELSPSKQPATLSTLMSNGFNPELMFGIPDAPSGRRPQNDSKDNRPESNYSEDNRASVMTFSTRTTGPRAPSFVNRDSAFFPNDGA